MLMSIYNQIRVTEMMEDQICSACSHSLHRSARSVTFLLAKMLSEASDER